MREASASARSLHRIRNFAARKSLQNPYNPMRIDSRSLTRAPRKGCSGLFKTLQAEPVEDPVQTGSKSHLGSPIHSHNQTVWRWSPEIFGTCPVATLRSSVRSSRTRPSRDKTGRAVQELMERAVDSSVLRTFHGVQGLPTLLNREAPASTGK